MIRLVTISLSVVFSIDKKHLCTSYCVVVSVYSWDPQSHCATVCQPSSPPMSWRETTCTAVNSARSESLFSIVFCSFGCYSCCFAGLVQVLFCFFLIWEFWGNLKRLFQACKVWAEWHFGPRSWKVWEFPVNSQPLMRRRGILEEKRVFSLETTFRPGSDWCVVCCIWREFLPFTNRTYTRLHFPLAMNDQQWLDLGKWTLSLGKSSGILGKNPVWILQCLVTQEDTLFPGTLQIACDQSPELARFMFLFCFCFLKFEPLFFLQLFVISAQIC